MKKRKTKKREATEEEMRLKKEENDRKRKQQMQRLQEEKKLLTINRILNLKKVKRTSKTESSEAVSAVKTNLWNELSGGMQKKFLSNAERTILVYKKEAITSKSQEYFPDRRLHSQVPLPTLLTQALPQPQEDCPSLPSWNLSTTLQIPSS
jgi:hypothetical protein